MGPARLVRRGAVNASSQLCAYGVAYGGLPIDGNCPHPCVRSILRALIFVFAGWRQRAKPSRRSGKVTGYGLAYIKYELVRTHVGVVCEVEADRGTGEIRANRFFVTHDCGQVINPDGARNQIEGNVIQTTSRVMKESVTFDRKMVTSLDWSTYPILTFPDVPEVVIDLIDRPENVPWGVGEATAAVVPAAIANAIYNAIGRRVRSVPFTPDKIKQALQPI